MSDDRWWKDFDLVVAATVPSGGRILDIGCGNGGLVERLAELGFDTVGVDPRAPAHAQLIRARLEQAKGLGDFDAITATMALHHADLAAVPQALHARLRPHGQLFVYEFSWDDYDERAAAWLADHDPTNSDNSVAAWRREHLRPSHERDDPTEALRRFHANASGRSSLPCTHAWTPRSRGRRAGPDRGATASRSRALVHRQAHPMNAR